MYSSRIGSALKLLVSRNNINNNNNNNTDNNNNDNDNANNNINNNNNNNNIYRGSPTRQGGSQWGPHIT